MNQMSQQTNGNGVFDELTLFTRLVTGLAGLTGLLYLRVVLGGGLIPAFRDNLTLWLPLTIGLLLLGIAGAALSWRWQGTGAVILLLSGLGLGAAFYWLQPVWGTAVFYGSPFFIAGILCFFCWRRQQPAR